jgi:hypothetical protein
MSPFLDLLADAFPALRREHELLTALEQATTPVEAARAMVTENPDGTRTVDERAAVTVPSLLDEIDRLTSAVEGMRDRAAAEISLAWPRLADRRTAAEQCNQVVKAVRALPLFPEPGTADAHAAAPEGRTTGTPGRAAERGHG